MIIDGAMGTYIRSFIKGDSRTDSYNITNRELVKSIHEEYIRAGTEIITTNTFITNYLWNESMPQRAEEVIREGIDIAKEASLSKGVKVALDITQGKKEQSNIIKISKIGEEKKVDFFLLETFMDLSESKKAIKEIRSESNIPIICSFSFQKNNVLGDGNSIEQVCMELEAEDIQYIGVNCSYGPEQCYEIGKRIKGSSSLPLMVKPNLGIPTEGGMYTKSLKEFKFWGEKYKELGVEIIGACCGSTPEYIKVLK